MSDTQKIQWDQPLEAAHEDGRVKPVFLSNRHEQPDRDGDYTLRVGSLGGMDVFKADGRFWDDRNIGWTIRNVAPKEVEWGPAIEVFYKKPWFIEVDTTFQYQAEVCTADCWHSWLDPDWAQVVSVRLKADHPYYDNTQTHTYTVASEDEAVLNASTPTRTALEQRMEDLVRRMASDWSYMADGRSFSAEARAILAELEPVDADIDEVHRISNEMMKDGDQIMFDSWEWKAMVACLKRGRALERGE